MTSSDEARSQLQRTPLYELHKRAGARLVEFSGWEMPVQYSSIVEEHQAVRNRVGLFDVSHMGEFHVEGPDAELFLQYLVPNDISRLQTHQALYTQLCLPDGNTIDDLLIYCLPEHYLLVVNAGNIEKDFQWITEQASGFIVTVSDKSKETALLALQGPLSEQILQPLTSTPLQEIAYYHCADGVVAGVQCLISRTGYTGEDGFELYFLGSEAVRLWEAIIAEGERQQTTVQPAGLGARDTLRLEAGYCLYGHELDEQTNPLEARLGWTVKLNKGEFIGRDALLTAKQEGPQKLLVGIELLDRGVPRSGYAIYQGEEQIGVLTSGTRGPSVQKNIALGYIKPAYAKVDEQVQIEIRGNRLAAKIVALPFYKRSK
jgi:aminomethyltransferase